MLRADAKIWHLLDEKCFDGIQTVNGKKPLEEALTEILSSYEVDSLLAVRPRRTTKQANEPKGTGQKNPRGKDKPNGEPENKKHEELTIKKRKW